MNNTNIEINDMINTNVFADERVVLHQGNLKRNLIRIIFFGSIIFTVLKFIFMLENNSVNFGNLIVEIELIIYSSVLIVQSNKLEKNNGDIKDERFYVYRSYYYNRTFKKFIFISLIIYSIWAGGIIIMQDSDFAFLSNSLLSIFIYFGLIYSFVYLKTKDTYLNASVIEKSNKVYYNKIFKTIFELLKMIGIMIGVTLIVGIILMIGFGKFQLLTILSLMIPHAISFLSVSLFYLIFSFIEKSNYNQMELIMNDNGNGFVTLTNILLYVVLFLCNITKTYLKYASNYNVNSGNDYLFKANISLGQYIAQMNMVINAITLIAGVALFICYIYLYYDIKTIKKQIKDNKANKLIKAILILHIISFVYSMYNLCVAPYTSALVIHMIGVKAYASLSVFKNYIIMILSIGTTIAELIMLCVICAKYKKDGYIITFIVYLIIYIVANLYIIIFYKSEFINKNHIQITGGIEILYNIIILLMFLLNKIRRKTNIELINKERENNI